ncbi:Ig-like domain-containing protein [Neobacillus sp. OS1-2]|uniref:Ig-like domain-containing protein n=1 Tax=Neobacillus sp. OS1-2 TaxID=3070680 RepID=UPI0027E1FC73|nr:Ig-like domain-containing protein [Neobacillus sp. OS1-2]WML41553.1 Ig-like domain-containing protein [Neobacillus sp. OS1-2]
MLKRKYVIFVVLSLLLIFQSLPVGKASAQSNSTSVMTSRLAGTDRYETSLSIVRTGWTHAANVIIATGLNFPDALSASALSKSKDAPIILTRPNSLSQDVMTELTKLGTTHAFIIGGTEVISTSVENQLKKLGIRITRLAGINRYDTSVKIAEEIGVNNGIAVATGENFPDALSMASIATIKSMPILLSQKAGLGTNTEKFIKGKKIPVSYILGGNDVLSTSLDQKLPNSKRLGGSTRYGTNILINTEFQASLNYDTVYLATGNSFPDALSGSALAAKSNAPILLTDKGSISTDTLNFMKKKHVKHVVILGGTEAVSQTVEAQINASLLVNATSISLNKTATTLKIGATEALTTTVSPANATNLAVKWSSSDLAVATVDPNGKVTAKSEGTATITVTTVDGNYTASCEVTVHPISVTAISISKTSATLKIGDKETLTATVSPANATNPAVKWSSSAPAVATVDPNGEVTAVSEGTATITVTTVDGNYTASCEVTVQPISVTSISLSKTSATLKIGDKETLTATVSPANATNPAVEWSSSASAVATIDANGKVIAKSEGTATITVTTADGNYTASCRVTVQPINVTSLSLNKTSGTLIVGSNETLIATVLPENATNKDRNWTSSDPSVATVDSTGTVTAVSEGTAMITATTVDGGFTARFSLNVLALKIESINDINSTVYQWDDYSLPAKAQVSMNNKTQVEKDVVWDSSSVDTSVIGVRTYQGTVEGYEDKVRLNLTVKSFQSSLLLTGTSSVIIGDYINSYGITLTNYLSRDIDISKIEIYDDGRLSGIYTKENLAASGISTTISPISQWNIRFSFRYGVSTRNSYFIVYIHNNGHDVPSVYQMKTN